VLGVSTPRLSPLPPLSALHHVIWDWNGTLVDDAWVCVAVMAPMPPSRYQAGSRCSGTTLAARRR
jgi:hypothetical protein